MVSCLSGSFAPAAQNNHSVVGGAASESLLIAANHAPMAPRKARFSPSADVHLTNPPRNYQ
jgi:hypothetical protein